MPSDPDHRIEELLKAYARKRREEAGAPLELHPATRRLLHAEVARLRRGAPTGGRSWREWLAIFWPRVVFATSVCLLLGTVSWLALQSQFGTGRGGRFAKQDATLDRFEKRPAEASATAAVRAGVERDEKAKAEQFNTDSGGIAAARGLAERERSDLARLKSEARLEDAANLRVAADNARRFALAPAPMPAPAVLPPSPPGAAGRAVAFGANQLEDQTDHGVFLTFNGHVAPGDGATLATALVTNAVSLSYSSAGWAVSARDERSGLLSSTWSRPAEGMPGGIGNYFLYVDRLEGFAAPTNSSLARRGEVGPVASLGLERFGTDADGARNTPARGGFPLPSSVSAAAKPLAPAPVLLQGAATKQIEESKLEQQTLAARRNDFAFSRLESNRAAAGLSGTILRTRYLRTQAAPKLPPGDKPGAAQNVLASFELEQNGQRVRVFDADGSIYEGNVLAESESLARARNEDGLTSSSKLMEKVDGAAKASVEMKRANPTAAAGRNAYFRVSGTNNRLNQLVVLHGEFVAEGQPEVTTTPRASMPTPAAPATAPPGSRSRMSPAAPSALSAPTKQITPSRILGRAVVGAKEELLIDAQRVAR